MAPAPLASPQLETCPLLGPCFWVLQLRSCKSHHCNAEALLQTPSSWLCQRPVDAVLRLLALSSGLTFSSNSAHPRPGQDLIRWPQTGGGACRGEKALANLLLNRSAIYANVRPFGAKCTGEVTYPARQLGVVVRERWVFRQGSLLAADLHPHSAQPLLLPALWLPPFVCRRERKPLGLLTFEPSKSGTTAMLKSFCCFIPWCPDRSSSPHLEQPLLTKL